MIKRFWEDESTECRPTDPRRKLWPQLLLGMVVARHSHHLSYPWTLLVCRLSLYDLWRDCATLACGKRRSAAKVAYGSNEIWWLVPLHPVPADFDVGGALETRRHCLFVFLSTSSHHFWCYDRLLFLRTPHLVPAPLSNWRHERPLRQAGFNRTQSAERSSPQIVFHFM